MNLSSKLRRNFVELIKFYKISTFNKKVSPQLYFVGCLRVVFLCETALLPNDGTYHDIVRREVFSICCEREGT